ncbi:MAG: phospholipase [Bacteroidota bacterium]
MIQNHDIKVSRTAHYSTLGTASPSTKYFIIACHGYGQMAKKFIRKFDVIASDEVFVVAPEGLSRFYWGGLTGDVVSSWMTKEDRLSEIEDYSNFIEALYQKYKPLVAEDAKIILLGFSQGCATIMRWAMRTFPECDHFAFWAGMIPEDIDYKPHLDYFTSKSISFFHGDEDPLITPERLAFIQKVIEDTGIKGVKEYPYKGVHKIERSFLKTWFEENIKSG